MLSFPALYFVFIRLSSFGVRGKANLCGAHLASRSFVGEEHQQRPTEAPKQLLEDVEQIRAALGYTAPKASKKKPQEPKAPEEEISQATEGEKPSEEPPGKRGNRAAQLNYEAKAKNFYRLIECAKGLPEYAPDEEDLNLETLSAFYRQLVQLNSEVIRKMTDTADARAVRNTLLYGDKGIYGTAVTVKQYARLAFKKYRGKMNSIISIPFQNK